MSNDTNSKKFSFKDLFGIVAGSILAICFSLFFIWIQFGGVYHAFKHHGVGDGFVSVFVPPFAWYRSIEFFFHSSPSAEWPSELVGEWKADAMVLESGEAIKLTEEIIELKNTDDSETRHQKKFLSLVKGTVYIFKKEGILHIYINGVLQQENWKVESRKKLVLSAVDEKQPEKMDYYIQEDYLHFRQEGAKITTAWLRFKKIR
jgi:hypothetical protein